MFHPRCVGPSELTLKEGPRLGFTAGVCVLSWDQERSLGTIGWRPCVFCLPLARTVSPQQPPPALWVQPPRASELADIGSGIGMQPNSPGLRLCPRKEGIMTASFAGLQDSVRGCWRSTQRSRPVSPRAQSAWLVPPGVPLESGFPRVQRKSHPFLAFSCHTAPPPPPPHK